MFWYSLANFGYGAFFALNNAVIPLFLQAFTQDARVLGIMASTHSFEGAIIQPVVGSASDRLRTRWGRRRPFMLIFIPLSALFIALTPGMGHLPGEVRLGAVLLSIFLFTVFFNVADDPYMALMPDITPVAQRGRVAAVSMFTLLLGQILFLLLGAVYKLPMALMFFLVAGIMLVTTALTCFTVREPRRAEALAEGEERSHHPFRDTVTALKGLKTLHQARKMLGVGFFSGLGIGAVFPFLTVFVKEITGGADSDAMLMFVVLMVSTAIGVLPFGWVSDRVGPKRVLFFGMATVGVAALMGLWVTTLAQITAVMALAGIGNAAKSASAYPLLTELVPAEEVGFYTGLQTTTLSIATPLTAVLTGWLINASRHLGGPHLPFEGFRIIFLVCAVCIFLSLAFLAALRQADAREEIRARDREQGWEQPGR
jgi:Na+/melibiose symporter-like transporter